MSEPPLPSSLPVVAPVSAPAIATGYGQILRSTTIVGGAQGLNLVIGLVRTKLVAMLLGPGGMGLVGLYQSVIGTMSTLTGLGLSSSGVRQVAEAAGSGDQICIGRTVQVLRRMCLMTGMLGTALSVLLAWPLSRWVFDSTAHAWALGLLGLLCLMDSLAAGRTALLQGMRHIGSLARVQVMSALAGTLVSIGLYVWLGEKGIVPVLLVSSLANLSVASWFAARISVPEVTITWNETLREARGLVSLGLAFMLSGLLTAAVALGTRALIMKSFGMDACGLYQAAWGISGVFAGFVLQAMGTDFFPRLTAVANDNKQINRMVNEQTEIGILLALPGLLATLVFTPWIIHLLYSASFAGASELLPWFVLGVFGRVVSWPLAFIQLAKGAARWFAAAETVFSLMHLLLVFLGLQIFGLKGVAIAFALFYGLYTAGVFWVARHLSEFFWSASTLRLLGGSAAVTIFSFVLADIVPSVWLAAAGGSIVVITGILCLRRLCGRLESGHRLVRLAGQIPGLGRWIVS